MKKIKQIVAWALVLVLSMSVISCSDNKKEEENHDELKSFMLGGIYFINGYGGMDQVQKILKSAGISTDEELINGYEELFEFPFGPEQGSDIKEVFLDMWDIHNGDDLKKTLEELKTEDNKYKAWDYARYVNNACMGYAAGYLSKDEAKKYITDLLPVAQGKYSDWKTYFEDYTAGRENWDANTPDAAAFTKIAKDVVENPKSIYNLIPLK